MDFAESAWWVCLVGSVVCMVAPVLASWREERRLLRRMDGRRLVLRRGAHLGGWLR